VQLFYVRAVLAGQFLTEQDAHEVRTRPADQSENPPGRYFSIHIEERAMPRYDVVKVGVDQSAVEVEKDGGLISRFIAAKSFRWIDAGGGYPVACRSTPWHWGLPRSNAG
jgi:hypothetical protein